MLSVSAFQVGHARRDSALQNRGVELYIEAIRIMSRELAPSRVAKGASVAFDLEMAGYALAVYEVSIDDQRKGCLCLYLWRLAKGVLCSQDREYSDALLPLELPEKRSN